MRLISLHLHQWRSFEDCPLEFPDGLIGARGPNGTGKSTIAEAIGWALFGRLREGGRVDELRRQGAPRGDRSFVELVFQLDSTVYRIERFVRGDAKLWINDQLETTKARDTNARVAQELELTWEVFERTVFAQQKDVAALDPSVGRDTRRGHVERLLGLSRYGEAGKRARGDAKALEQQLAGRRAVAPDPKAIEDELREAERQAARDDPAVAQAEQNLADAKGKRDGAKAKLDAERERANTAQVLGNDLRHARELADRAKATIAKLEERIGARDQKRTRLVELAPEVAQTAEAEAMLAKWNELADATRELEEVQAELAAISFDPEAAAALTRRLADLRDERSRLIDGRSEAQAAADRTAARLAAFHETAEAGASSGHDARTRKAEGERQRLAEELAVLRAQLDLDRAHLREVESGGPETPCPVCRKPYGSEYEQILAGYCETIERAERRQPELQERIDRLTQERDAAAEALTRARRAEERLAETAGADTVEEAERLLAEARARLEQLDARITEIDTELPQLDQAVREEGETGRRWAERAAIRADRVARRARAAEALAVDEYDREVHEEAKARRDHLAALEAEAVRLQAAVEAESGLEQELSAERDSLSNAKQKEKELAKALADLAFDPARLGQLAASCEEAEKAYEQARDRVHEAKLKAQERSQRVQDLRRRLEEAREARKEIERGEIEVRQHQVAAELLDKFREYQAQRAWPWLEQGASALLAATTDGRYADVRLSDDYRLVIVDRGEEHLLPRYSGGEQDLANLCLRLAIADWVARQRGVEIEFVILDEVFGSQDEERRQRVLGELRALSNRFRQVLVITHVPEIADLCDHQLEVRLEEPGRSLAAFAG